MKKLKMFVCIALAAALLWHNGGRVYAATHAPGCGSRIEAVICGGFIENVPMGSHMLYITANGTEVRCCVTAEKHFHLIKCPNPKCNAVYESKAARTCIEKHQHCPDQTGMCQY